MRQDITNLWSAAAERPLLDVPIRIVHEPDRDWNYAHHPFLARFRSRFYLFFSLGRHQEDDVGQRVMVTSSADFETWTTPRELARPERDETGVLIPAGTWADEERLNAYVLCFDYKKEVLSEGRRRPGSAGRERWGFRCLTTGDGRTFAEVPGPEAFGGNMPVRKLRSGRLFSCGGRTCARTEDPRGLTGWQGAAVFPEGWRSPEEEAEPRPLLPGEVSSRRVDLCEGSALQLDDGRLLMLLRSGTPWLWASESADEGATWSLPERTAFTDNRTKFFLDRLPDGRYFYIGTPDPFPPRVRQVLALSLSRDGKRYDRHFVLADRQFKGRYPGLDKNGIYGYPTALAWEGEMYITCSINKEMIAVMRLPLEALGKGKEP